MNFNTKLDAKIDIPKEKHCPYFPVVLSRFKPTCAEGSLHARVISSLFSL